MPNPENGMIYYVGKQNGKKYVPSKVPEVEAIEQQLLTAIYNYHYEKLQNTQQNPSLIPAVISTLLTRNPAPLLRLLPAFF